MKEDPESALSAGIVANVPMKRYRPQMGSIKVRLYWRVFLVTPSLVSPQAKVILNIDPHLRMGRKDEALLQEKFLDGIEKAEQEVARIKTWLSWQDFDSECSPPLSDSTFASCQELNNYNELWRRAYTTFSNLRKLFTAFSSYCDII